MNKFLDSLQVSSYRRCPSAYRTGIQQYKYPSPEHITGFEGGTMAAIYVPYVFHIAFPCIHQMIRVLSWGITI